MSDLDLQSLQTAVGDLCAAIDFHEVIGSTNTRALELAQDGAESWTLVIAANQTSGRGRLDRTWFAPEGTSLTFTLVIRRPPDERGALLNLAAAVGVAEGLSRFVAGVGLKWPNDVQIDGKKVCGILTEARSSSSGAVAALGVGINVGVDEFPPEIAQSATSIKLAAGRDVARLDVLTEVLTSLRVWMSAPAADVLDRFRQLCGTLGREVRIETATGEMEGLALDVNERGGLVLDGGRVVYVGDVIHVR